MRDVVILDPPRTGPIWHLSPALAAVWPEGDPWPVRKWLTTGAARIIKKGPQRTVIRVDLPGLSFFWKQHHLPDRLTWLRQCLRSPKGRRENDQLLELAKRGVPAPEPLGWGAGREWGCESFALTRALDDVVPLTRLSVDASQRHGLADALGRFLAKLHEAGVDQRDLHLGNVLARSAPDGNFDLFLVDLDAVRIGAALDRGRSLANLAILGSGCYAATARTDRLRFLRRYAANRGWLDPANDRCGPRELADLAAAIERQTWAYCQTFWARRDERCLRTNRYYRVIAEGSFVGMALRGVDEDWLARLCRDPDSLFHERGVKVLKDSKTSTVAEIVAPIDGTPRRVILKKIGATRWTDPWTALVRPTPILRSWVSGQGLLERNLPTPRPLVMVHRRRHGLWHDGYLVTEKLDGVQELDDYVKGLAELPAAERRRRLWRQIERVARAIRDLHRRHLSHRDLKAPNLLVTTIDNEDTPAGAARAIWSSPFPVANTTLWFIDLVGVSRHARLGRRRRVQNLARLNASFLQSPMLTRGDRLRFLRIYLVWGIHGKGDWKKWWRAIATATAAKAARNQKAGRTLE
jgi:tRNA A-37 threonylcarbamoyl transferase component Bud32